jgi:putative tryptophan/tyrosine transport system substrate-binding protein
VKAIGETLTLCALFFALCFSAEAQQRTKVPRIGYLSGSTLAAQAVRTEAFRQGLRELGYVEGKNIVIEWRYAEGKPDRLNELAAELVRQKVDIIVTAGAEGTRAAKKVTTTIPIVMTQDSDPVGTGFIASLARPGGNITGLSSYSAELSGKRLELLKEVLPRLSRVALFGTSTAPQQAQVLKGTESAAATLGVKLQYLDILDFKDIGTAFRTAGNGRADAVLMNASGPIANPHRKEIVELAVKSRLPVMHSLAEDVGAGGLIFYGVSQKELDRHAAIYVDKILKGAKPADLPVEQPTKFELVINLKTAKQIGLTIPPNVLARADRVIK